MGYIIVINYYYNKLEKEMATHAIILAWKSPLTEEPGLLHTVHGIIKSLTQLSNLTNFTYCNKW